MSVMQRGFHLVKQNTFSQKPGQAGELSVNVTAFCCLPASDSL